jgi:hypothetical protein
MRKLMGKFLSRNRRRVAPPEIHGILARDAFEEQLVRERARADRARSSFALLTFSFSGPMTEARRHEAEALLCSLIARRSRSIDIKGWHGKGIGLLLPYTAPANVEKVWTNIEELFKKALVSEMSDSLPLPHLRCEVMAYPHADVGAIHKVS